MTPDHKEHIEKLAVILELLDSKENAYFSPYIKNVKAKVETLLASGSELELIAWANAFATVIQESGETVAIVAFGCPKNAN